MMHYYGTLTLKTLSTISGIISHYVQNNGIVINKEKFQFCSDEVLLDGLEITNTGMEISDDILSSTQDFPTPQNVTDARSWFGLINQVVWSCSISPFMEPFYDLVRPNTKFNWGNKLDEIFSKSKELLISYFFFHQYSFVNHKNNSSYAPKFRLDVTLLCV